MESTAFNNIWFQIIYDKSKQNQYFMLEDIFLNYPVFEAYDGLITVWYNTDVFILLKGALITKIKHRYKVMNAG